MAGYKEAAVAVLRDAGGPLGYQEITRRAIDEGHLKPRGRTPVASMSAALYKNIKVRGEASEFRLVDKNSFELRRDSTKDRGKDDPGDGGRADPVQDDADGRTASADNLFAKGGKADPVQDDAQDAAGSRRIGAAGRFRVMSELLFRGYGVDRRGAGDGIDIRASKGRDNFRIQVKAVTRNNNDRYITSIKKQPFDKNDAPNMYYVFVLRDPGNKINFVVMSSRDIKKRIGGGDITSNRAGYQASFKKDGGEIFLGSRDVELYRNDWDLG